MAAVILDRRDLLPAERNPGVMDAFAGLESGEPLKLINDQEPRPLSSQLEAETEFVAADGYAVEQCGSNEYLVDISNISVSTVEFGCRM